MSSIQPAAWRAVGASGKVKRPIGKRRSVVVCTAGSGKDGGRKIGAGRESGNAMVSTVGLVCFAWCYGGLVRPVTVNPLTSCVETFGRYSGILQADFQVAGPSRWTDDEQERRR
jgi:hypothetical protein